MPLIRAVRAGMQIQGPAGLGKETEPPLTMDKKAADKSQRGFTEGPFANPQSTCPDSIP